MAATKKYPDHGGVMSVQESLYHAAHEFPGGLKGLSERYEWSRGSMLNKLSLEQEKPVPTLENFCQILSATRDPRILTAVCEPIGAVWHWADEVNDTPADLDVLSRGSALMTSASAVIDELVRSLDDGQIDAVEMTRIRQKMFELQREMQAVKQTAEQFEVKGEA